MKYMAVIVSVAYDALSAIAVLGKRIVARQRYASRCLYLGRVFKRSVRNYHVLSTP
jgi:hypothetical protein